MLQVEGQDDHLEAIREAILRSLGGLGGDLSKNSRSVKNERPYSVLASFLDSWEVQLESLGEHFGQSWRQVGVSWSILASNWHLLGKMLELRSQRWFDRTKLSHASHPTNSGNGGSPPIRSFAEAQHQDSWSLAGKPPDCREKQCPRTLHYVLAARWWIFMCDV